MSGKTYRGVAVPKVLAPNWGTLEAHWWRQGVRAVLDLALPLFEALTDDETCSLDHHGQCQTHWGGEADGRCAVVVAREFLEVSAEPEYVWRATIADPYLYWCTEHRPAVAVAQAFLADIHPSVVIECVQCGRRVR